MGDWTLIAIVYVIGWIIAGGYLHATLEAPSYQDEFGRWLSAALIAILWPVALPMHLVSSATTSKMDANMEREQAAAHRRAAENHAKSGGLSEPGDVDDV